ncbi:hypothetical protein [Dysgonomonas sp. BGC7]|uniref:hypothetical protein n=1 Tax=Dysgonomonas sp. BGC7 TaxID=1658008 RepID=UPI000680D196|nr:hypothetical protein [Dysgonomonas sp. BGC7]MBD8388277.1 hypothetical protein [Dysgonomonas sp. BGC7]
MSKIELKSEVEQLLAEVDKTHRYSMSKIYDVANRVFDKNETPQSCASCLIRKVRELRKWLEDQNEENIPSVKSTSTGVKKKKSGRKIKE